MSPYDTKDPGAVQAADAAPAFQPNRRQFIVSSGLAAGGLALGSYGPVTEGVFIWTAGLGALLLAAVWIGAKVR